MTKGELKEDMRNAIKYCKSFDSIIDELANYVKNNFKLKKVIISNGKGKRNKSKH